MRSAPRSIAEHQRKARPHSGGREPIPAHLPGKEILHDLPEHQKWCAHGHEGVCGGRQRIGEEVIERYHFEPAKVWVEQHVCPNLRRVLMGGVRHGEAGQIMIWPAIGGSNCRRLLCTNVSQERSEAGRVRVSGMC